MSKHFWLGCISCLFLCLPLSQTVAFAAPTFIPPLDVTIKIYRLFDDGSKYVDPMTHSYYLCNTGDVYRGCTVNVSNPPPFEGLNPATISINDNYLLTVLPSEVPIQSFHLKALEAQAIAARSYTFWHLWKNHNIDNSTSFQVFVPHQYDYLNSTDQQKVLAAVANHSYLTYSGDPLFGEFFSDIPARTISGTEPGLINIDDLISTYPTIIMDGHGRGMSQRGASRWAYGNMGFQGNLTPWSVTFQRTEQILFHYYTNAILLDENQNLISASFRWAPQKIESLPSFILSGSTYRARIYIQNIGTENWACSYPYKSFELKYWWQKDSNLQLSDNSISLCGLLKGDPTKPYEIVINNPPFGTGSYTLKFDIKITFSNDQTIFFSQQQPAWPTYDQSVFVVTTASTYLPITINEQFFEQQIK
jgi:hypothetical protein